MRPSKTISSLIGMFLLFVAWGWPYLNVGNSQGADAIHYDLSPTEYLDPKGFFRITPPKGWISKEYYSKSRGKVIFESEKMSILVGGRTTAGYSFEEMVQEEKETSKGLLEKYREYDPKISFYQSNLDGAPLLISVLELPNRTISESYFFMRGKTEYVFGYTASSDLFDRYIDLAMKSFQSFDPLVQDRPTHEISTYFAASKTRVAKFHLEEGRYENARRAIREGLEIYPKNSELIKLKRQLER